MNHLVLEAFVDELEKLSEEPVRVAEFEPTEISAKPVAPPKVQTKQPLWRRALKLPSRTGGFLQPGGIHGERSLAGKAPVQASGAKPAEALGEQRDLLAKTRGTPRAKDFGQVPAGHPSVDTPRQAAIRSYYRQHGIDEPALGTGWSDWKSRVPVDKKTGTVSRSAHALPQSGPLRGEMRAIVEAAAERRGIDPAILTAQLRRESGFNPYAQSHTGPLGIAQFTRNTGRGYGLLGESESGERFDIREDPTAAADASARLMKDLLGRYKGDVPMALAAYNWGGGSIRDAMSAGGVEPGTSILDPRAFGRLRGETQNYLRGILGEVGGYDLPPRVLAER